jgi:VanZ family protein
MQLLDQAPVNDKVEHFAAYAVLAALPALRRFRAPSIRAVMAFLFLLGAALEVAQIFIPGRSCDWRDLLADSCGIALGVAAVRTAQRIRT